MNSSTVKILAFVVLVIGLIIPNPAGGWVSFYGAGMFLGAFLTKVD